MRTFFGLLIIGFLIVSCSEDKKSIYLQEQQIGLAMPKVVATSSIIDSSIIVTATLPLSGTEIFYTTDGTEPSPESLSYKNPLEISEEGLYKFKAFHADWKASETASLKLHKRGLTPEKVTWHSTTNEKYPGIGDSTLVNNKRASLSFMDSQWVGYDSIVRSTVYFEEKTFVKSISIGYLIDSKSWIFPPEAVSVKLGKQEVVGVTLKQLKKDASKKTESITLSIEKEIDSLVVEINNVSSLPEWHPGSGNKAWLFMDEWIFN